MGKKQSESMRLKKSFRGNEMEHHDIFLMFVLLIVVMGKNNRKDKKRYGHS